MSSAACRRLHRGHGRCDRRVRLAFEQAQRQALIDLAAACVAMAARLPAPIQALNERELRSDCLPDTAPG